MLALRIFISYAHTGDEQGTTIARRLISDLRATGTNVVTESDEISENRLMPYLKHELHQYHFLLFIQTPQALESMRVQTATGMALLMVAHNQLKGILRLIAVPSLKKEEQLFGAFLRTIDANRDYLPARTQLFQELGLLDPDSSSCTR